MISVTEFMDRVKCEALTTKASGQRSFASMIVALVEHTAIIPVFVISSLIIFLAPLLGWFVALVSLTLYAIAGTIMIITLIAYKKCSWIDHINNINYKWFWWTHKLDLTNQMKANNINVESLNDFLMSLDNNTWYIKDYRIKIPDHDNITTSTIKYVLVFRHRTDAVQCRMVI